MNTKNHILKSLIASLALLAVGTGGDSSHDTTRPNPDAPDYRPDLWNDATPERVLDFTRRHRSELIRIARTFPDTEQLGGRKYSIGLDRLGYIFFKFSNDEIKTYFALAPDEIQALRRDFADVASGVQQSANCYGYSADDRSGNPPGWKHEPGDKSGLPKTDPAEYTMDGKALIRRLKADGFELAGSTPGWRPGYYSVALFVDPGKLFHFVRQNRDGTWSHKNGHAPVTNLDFGGRLITDPRAADMGHFRFVTYLYAPKGGLDVSPPPRGDSDSSSAPSRSPSF